MFLDVLSINRQCNMVLIFHPRICFMGALSRDQQQLEMSFLHNDLLIVLGADVLACWAPVEPFDGMPIIQIGQRDRDGKKLLTEMVVRADIKETMAALMPILKKGGQNLKSKSTKNKEVLRSKTGRRQRG